MSLGIGIYRGAVYFKGMDEARAVEAYNAYVETLKNDTYGGKTPEETLKLFLDALKEGDVEKASLYFALDDNGSRQKWLDHLIKVKEKGLLATMVNDIEMLAKPADQVVSSRFLYEIYNLDGTVGVAIILTLQGDIWKMESF